MKIIVTHEDVYRRETEVEVSLDEVQAFVRSKGVQRLGTLITPEDLKAFLEHQISEGEPPAWKHAYPDEAWEFVQTSVEEVANPW